MSTNALIYDRERIDIGVPVVTYEDAGAPSFYQPKLAKHFSQIDTLFEGVAGKRKDKVNKVVLHHDGTRNSPQCFEVLVQRGLSTHLMIDADGTVYQPMNLRDMAYHAAGVNDRSIGIDINNPVYPDRVADPSSRGVFRGEINGGNTASLGYTDAQYDSAIAVLDGLCRTFPNIPRLAPIGPDGRVPRRKLVNTDFAGIVGHLHVSANKWDPGPGFDWERVLIGLRGERLHFPVTLPGTVNLADVPKHRAFKEAESYFRATEEGDGGYYPFGVNQAWHTGVHFDLDPGTAVVAPASGTILAARQMDPTSLGSANFVLIAHQLEVGGKPMKCFSVLMHLQKEELSSKSPIPWIRRLFLKTDGDERLPRDDADHPKSAQGSSALVAGRTALIDVPLKAGELVGHVGTFTGDLEQGTPTGVLDFALISAKPLVAKGDISFEVVDEDDGDDILCNARSIWKRLTRKPEVLRALSEGGYPLDPFEIRRFFNDDVAAREYRWLVARHVTEYSAKTDFSGLFGGGIDFEWSARKRAKRYLDRIRPFLWWDEGVTEHAGLPADRRVFSHHPITVLTVLARAEARKALEVGKDGPEVAYEGDALVRQRNEDAKLEAQFKMENFNTVPIKVDIEGGTDLDAPLVEDPEREGWMRWEQNEWEPE